MTLPNKYFHYYLPALIVISIIGFFIYSSVSNDNGAEEVVVESTEEVTDLHEMSPDVEGIE